MDLAAAKRTASYFKKVGSTHPGPCISPLRTRLGSRAWLVEPIVPFTIHSEAGLLTRDPPHKSGQNQAKVSSCLLCRPWEQWREDLQTLFLAAAQPLRVVHPMWMYRTALHRTAQRQAAGSNREGVFPPSRTLPML